MLADGPHLRWGEEVEAEEARVAMGMNPQIGQGRRCSWSVRVESVAEREGGAAGRGMVSGVVSVY